MGASPGRGTAGSHPAADFYLTEGRSTWCSTAQWDDPVVLRINLQHEGRNRSGEDVMESLLHLGAHAMSQVEGRSITQGEGRYHSSEYRAAARVLDAERAERRGFAFGVVTLARGSNTRYKSEIAKLDRALARWEAVPIRAKNRTSVALVCECAPETIAAGLKKRGLPADTGIGVKGTRLLTAPKRILAPSGTAARGGSSPGEPVSWRARLVTLGPVFFGGANTVSMTSTPLTRTGCSCCR